MAVAIIDTITTIAEVCLLQGHNMNTMADAAAARIFSDDLISTVINNTVRFVYGNSDEDLVSEVKMFAINTISVLALNNIMFESGYLPNWTIVDPFDKNALNYLIQNKKETNDIADIVPLYRKHYHLWTG
jgi:thioredoxin reductase